MIDKLKSIDSTRKDLQTILEGKGVNLTGSSKSLSSLVANVSQLSLNNEVNPDKWTGVTKQEDPGTYWKGDGEWRELIDIDAIMEADTNEYSGKVFFLIRCSDNPVLDVSATGYTKYAIVGLQAFRFSDSDAATLSTTTEHKFDSSKDIVAPNGERFRWIIGYTNSTTAVVLWQGAYFIPEAVVYWSGTYRGLCFEDVAPYNESSFGKGYSYDNGSGGNNFLTSFSITNYNSSYLTCVGPRYFELKDGVTTQFLTGYTSNRYLFSVISNRAKTIIIDGTVVCEFYHTAVKYCTYFRSTKAGYRNYVSFATDDNDIMEDRYICANVTGCKGTVYVSTYGGYIELTGDMPIGSALSLGVMKNVSLLADNVGGLNGGNVYHNCDIDLGVIQGNVGEKCFLNFNGHLKFTRIEQNIGNWAFFNAKYIPNEIIVKKRDNYTTTHTMGYGAFTGTNVEKIDLRDSAITALNTTIESPMNSLTTNATTSAVVRNPFYNAKYLKIIHLPKHMTTIPNYGLSYLQSLTTVTLPENLITIGNYAFYYDGQLESISIPNTVQIIGQEAFNGCRNLKTLQLDSPLITSLPTSMCYNCYALETVTLPPKLVTIGGNTFMYCRNLKRVVLPNSVTKLSAYAFQRMQIARISYTRDSGYNATRCWVFCLLLCFERSARYV